MATKKNALGPDETSCPWCAETIKSAAIVCKHCKREIDSDISSVVVIEPEPEVSPKLANTPQTKSGSSQQVWGIILISFGGLSIFSADFSVAKLLFQIALPLSLGVWLILKAKKIRRGDTNEKLAQEQMASTISGITSTSSDLSKVVAGKTKNFLSNKKNRNLTIIAVAALVLLVITVSLKTGIDNNARLEAAAIAQAEDEKQLAVLNLASAISDSEKLITDGNIRYEESIAWSEEANRASLKSALTKLETALISKNYNNIITTSKDVSAAYKAVGTQAEATARAEAAAKVAAAKAEAEKIANETTGQRNAKDKAKRYLNSQSFSRQGLIEQLEYEGYTLDEATYGTDETGADWNEQAAKKGASYLKSQSFSSQGLLSQLLYEGFSQGEAEYGVSQNGY